uniref:TLC domain-containing protein n=1 Tax=Rhabditophanes sp. KR3021 TaxID=114890 RepID=A0AC35TS23_9BILA
MTGGFAGKTKFKKVAETAWRFSYFSFAVGLGYWAINDSEHLYDIIQCWTNWPYQHINDKVWTYYMIEIGFYWALLFSQIFFDIKRSDFWQMILHHGITIFLLFISFSINFVRVGTLVLISHDFTDIFIEFAKLIRYAGWNTTLEYFFVIFMIVWIGTRLVYYPFWIIYSVVFDAPALIEKTYSWTNITQSPIVPRILLGMLLGLLVLHIFWTILLVNIAIKSIKGGELGDAREEGDSDSDVELESSSSTDSETEKSKKNK